MLLSESRRLPHGGSELVSHQERGHDSGVRRRVQAGADFTSGHGIIRYVGLIAISADTPGKLQAALVAIGQAAIQASCDTRTLVGQQAQSFTAAALSLCRTV